MLKIVFISSLLAVFAAGSVALANNGNAPCGSFQKLPSGSWNVLKPVKIEHGTTSAVLQAGTTIHPGTHVSGVDLYDALQKSCQTSTTNSSVAH